MNNIEHFRQKIASILYTFKGILSYWRTKGEEEVNVIFGNSTDKGAGLFYPTNRKAVEDIPHNGLYVPGDDGGRSFEKISKKLKNFIKYQLQQWFASLPNYIKTYLPILKYES